MLSSRTATRSVALSRMSAANSSSELVIVLSLFLKETRLSMIS